MAQEKVAGGGASTPSSDHDTLSGLLSRSGFNERVRSLIDDNPTELYLLVYGDIDRFKVYNDLFGTQAGDRLLADIGTMLRDLMPTGAVAARLRADHFVCCLPRSSFEPDRILAAFDTWFSSYRDDFTFFVRLGMYVIDDPSLDVNLMCDRALLALRAAKSGYVGSKYVFYDEKLRATVLKEQELAGEMIAALESGQFVPFFQPQYRYTTGRMEGAEVLARWVHPTKGLLGPLEFIPVFERNGLVSTFDYHLWDCACRCLRTWIDRFGIERVPRLSVNLSRADIYRADLCPYLTELVSRYGIPCAMLHLEITESAYMDAPEQLIDAVKKLRAAGFTVEMDDFGSGYSSLNTLKDVPVDVLKLDMGFLDTSNNTRGGIVLASIVRMARWLGLPVIAEGVETDEQAAYLASVGCDIMQGFLFSKPVDRAAFEQLLEGEVRAEDVRERAVTTYLSAQRYRGVKPLEDAASAAALEADESAQDASEQRAFGVRLRAIIDCIPGGIGFYQLSSTSLVMIDFSDTAAEVFGCPNDQFVMRSAEDPLFSILREDRWIVEGLMAELLAGGSRAKCTLRIVRVNDGAIRWISLSASTVSRVGGMLFVVAVFLDVTEEKERDLEFRRQVEQQRELYEAIPCGIVRYTVEDEPYTVSINKHGCAILGYRDFAEYVSATGCQALMPLHEDDALVHNEVVKRLKEGSPPISFSYRFHRRDGSLGWLEGTSALETQADGAMIVQSAFVDVSDQRQKSRERDLQRYATVLCSVYEEIYEIDGAQGTYRMLFSAKQPETSDVVLPLDVALDRWLSYVPDADDRVKVRKAVDECRRSEAGQPVVCTYLVEFGGESAWCQSTFLRVSESSALCCNKDVTERLTAEDRKLVARIADTIGKLPVGVGVYTLRDGSLYPLYVNDPMCAMFGYAPEEYAERIARSIPIATSDDVMKLMERFDLQEVLEKGLDVEMRTRRRDGSPIDIRIQGRALQEGHGDITLYAAVTDVTAELRERHERAWQNERYRLLSEMTHAISFDYDSDADTVLLYIDRTGKGMEAQVIPHYLETLNSTRESVVHPDSMDTVRHMFEDVRAGANEVSIEYQANYYGRGYAWYRANLFVVHDDEDAWHLVGLIENIDSERDLRFRAEYDGTTGLSNHEATKERITAALADPDLRANSVCAVLDIDDFKNVNDSCGHMEGDVLLNTVGGILRSNFRDSDIIGRVGGDEFVLLLKNIDLEIALAKLECVSRRISATSLDSLDRAPSVSIGIYATTPDDHAYRDVFVKADEALYQAKRSGKNRIQVYRA